MRSAHGQHAACMRSACGQHSDSTWPACGQHMVSMHSACGQHGLLSACGQRGVSMRPAHGQHMVIMRTACGQHMVSMQSACGLCMISPWSACAHLSETSVFADRFDGTSRETPLAARVSPRLGLDWAQGNWINVARSSACGALVPCVWNKRKPQEVERGDQVKTWGRGWGVKRVLACAWRRGQVKPGARGCLQKTRQGQNQQLGSLR